MFAILLGFPFLAISLIIQMVIVSRVPMLHGTADLVLLILAAWALQERVTSSWIWTIIGGLLVSFASALPSFSPLIGYLVITGFARLLQRHVWQTPILAMFATTFLGTLVMHGISYLVLQISGVNLPLEQSLSLVTLPSALLNLLLALPVYAVVKDLAAWLYPIEMEL